MNQWLYTIVNNEVLLYFDKLHSTKHTVATQTCQFNLWIHFYIDYNALAFMNRYNVICSSELNILSALKCYVKLNKQLICNIFFQPTPTHIHYITKRSTYSWHWIQLIVDIGITRRHQIISAININWSMITLHFNSRENNILSILCTCDIMYKLLIFELTWSVNS